MRPSPGRGPIALVGLRGAGKTTLGRALAARLGSPFVDLDEHLVGLQSRLRDEPAEASAGALLERLGESGFRALEWAGLEALLGEHADPDPDLVVATGGGVVETPACRARLARLRCVRLVVPLDELARRVAAAPGERPALNGDDPVGEIPEVAARREPWYAEVAWRTLDLDGLGVDAAVDALVRLIGRG